MKADEMRASVSVLSGMLEYLKYRSTLHPETSRALEKERRRLRSRIQRLNDLLAPPLGEKTK
jgi:hypothetical protein